MKEKNEVIENLEEKTEEVMEDVTDIVEDIKDEGYVESDDPYDPDKIERERKDMEDDAHVLAFEEHQKDLEKEVSETREEISEEIAEVEDELASQIKNMKKHDAANMLVKKAKIIVDDAEGQLEKCKLLLSDDLKEYEAAKTALKEGGLDECEALLSELKYVDDSEETLEEDSVVFEPTEDLEPIRLQDVSSGRFTGFIYSLIGGGLTLAGIVYYATKKLGMTLDVSKVPSIETAQTIFGWVGAQVGRPDDATNGALLVGIAVLAVMGLIYAIRVSMKGSKNLHFATKQLEEAEVYTAHKGNCKEEMDKVDTHIHDAISTLKTYQVLLNEQKGKLQRILYIEGEKEELTEYHQKSVSEMQNTQGLINSIRGFMSKSMSEEGKLSAKSTLFLHSAKSKMQKEIDKLY